MATSFYLLKYQIRETYSQYSGRILRKMKGIYIFHCLVSDLNSDNGTLGQTMATFEEKQKILKLIITSCFIFITLIACGTFMYLGVEVEMSKLVFCALFGSVIGKPLHKVSLLNKLSNDGTLTTTASAETTAGGLDTIDGPHRSSRRGGDTKTKNLSLNINNSLPSTLLSTSKTI